MTRRLRSLFLVPIIFAFLLLSPATTSIVVQPVHAGGIGVFATEITQLLNNLQLIEQNLTAVQQLEQQFAQYAVMLQNTANIPNQVFSGIQADLNDLANVVNTGAGLAYSMQNLDQQFQLAYPTYNPASGSTSFPTQYQSWNDNTMASIRNTLMGVGLRGSQLNSEQSVLDSLKQMSQSNTGAVQAAQTGNQIAVEQVAQLQKLQTLMLMDMQSKQAYFANQTQGTAAQQQMLNQTFQPLTVVGSSDTF